MLPTKRRLSSAFFNQNETRGEILIGDFFNLKKIKKQGQKAKFAVLVSKKVSGSAYKRNQLRRRGYVVLGSLLGRVKDDFMYVLYAKKGAIEQDKTSLAKDIESLFKKAGTPK